MLQFGSDFLKFDLKFAMNAFVLTLTFCLFNQIDRALDFWLAFLLRSVFALCSLL